MELVKERACNSWNMSSNTPGSLCICRGILHQVMDTSWIRLDSRHIPSHSPCLDGVCRDSIHDFQA
eukprot:6559788-Lingulodinium_polyedra.AAC.1